MRGVVDRETFEKMLKLLNKTDFRSVVFPDGSNCKIKAKKYINCRRDFSEMMSQVLCRTWYSKALYNDNDLMVDVFRKNIKKAWNEYNATCGRRRGDKLNPQTWRRL